MLRNLQPIFKTQISGWGRVSDRGETSPVLKQADVPYVNQEVCKMQYKSIEIDITSSMMCAGIIGIGGIDACNGDSGGKSSAFYIFYLLVHFCVFSILKVQ